MQYSIPRDGRPGDPPKVLHDWICTNVRTFLARKKSICLSYIFLTNVFPQCGVQNFRRRDQCFKCNEGKPDVEGEGAEEIALHPTDSESSPAYFLSPPFFCEIIISSGLATRSE